MRAVGAGAAATALLFVDGEVCTGGDPNAGGFALRENSPEVHRLLLHALSRFARGQLYVVPRDQQRVLSGVASALPRSDAVFVPLTVADRMIGLVVIEVSSAPDERILVAVDAYARLAARIVEADRAVVAAGRQVRNSQLLASINERLRRSSERRDVLYGIAEDVRATFGAARCIVWERDPRENDVADVVAVAFGAEVYAQMPTRFEYDTHLRRAFSGAIIRVDEVDEGVADAYLRSLGVCGAIMVPVAADGHVEYVLALHYARPHAFDDADVLAVRAVAHHLGLALTSARSYERERARRTRSESLERVVRILRDTQYADEVLMVFVVTVSHEQPVDCAAFVLEENDLVREAHRTREPEAFTPAERIDRRTISAALLADDPSNADILPRTLRAALFDESDGIVVPLRVEGRLYGMLAFSIPSGAFDWSSEERSSFFRTLGSHLEIALANAHAYEREQRRAQERSTLAEAARTILSYTDLRTLADSMSQLAANLVQSPSACVLRWNGDRYEVVGSQGAGAADLAKIALIDPNSRIVSSTEFEREGERRVARMFEGPGYAIVPLSATAGAGAVDALMIVGRENAARFTRDELRLLQELGALLALALRNLELYDATHRANSALQESNQFKDDLLAMLAHDFKSPLSVILGYCELLIETTETQKAEIEMIHSQATRLVRLSDDALVLAQTQSEGFSLARTVVDLGGFVTEALSGLVKETGRVRIEETDTAASVSIDPQRFRHVIDNLVMNALKYSEKEVAVRVLCDGEQALFEVQDQGIGIPESEINALFTRFGRASNARQKGIAGSGVGLYVSRKIVEVHRGTIVVRSKENEGSVFTVTLPLANV